MNDSKFKAVHWWMNLTVEEQNALSEEYHGNDADFLLNNPDYFAGMQIDPIKMIYNGEIRKKKIGLI